MRRSEPLDVLGAAMLATGTLVLAVLALTESFQLLPAALAAYAGAWWVLGLERRHQSRARSGESR